MAKLVDDSVLDGALNIIKNKIYMGFFKSNVVKVRYN